MSERSATASWPICCAALCSVSGERPVMMTCAPSAANARAALNPIPLLPPITTIFLSLKRSLTFRPQSVTTVSMSNPGPADQTLDTGSGCEGSESALHFIGVGNAADSQRESHTISTSELLPADGRHHPRHPGDFP